MVRSFLLKRKSKVSYSDFVIVGAGLSGLLTAKRLREKGYSVRIVEARNRIGGRIHTLKTSDHTLVEMGATWFGAQHINLRALLDELKLGYYEQFMDGAAYFEAFSTAPPQKIEFPKQAPSFRIKGGTEQIINALSSELNDSEIVLGQKVVQASFAEDRVEIISETDTYYAKYLILTIPPALLVENVSFKPDLPKEIMLVSTQTHTWMHDSIKLALTFKEPFWRNSGLSGTVFSNVGPITEFYDHCNFEVNTYALCGFVNGAYASLNKEERKEMVLAQLVKTFGEVSLSYVSYEETVWKKESYTSPVTGSGLFPHQNNGHPTFQESFWNNHLFIAGTETSPQFGGYMDGAVARIEALVKNF
ncbi:monoamine oxidase [Spirosomataceae bacterium TFI 002]|nr:monoamine oxidase [Spirosomataceae bacterium TFI 002]